MKFKPILACTWLTMLSGSAAAAERHFGFSHESSALAPGLAELEPWTTVHLGRSDYYSRIDARLGFQFGLAKSLQAALFWDASNVTEDILVPGAALKSRLSTTELQSLTAELKYKFSDPIADALGSALLVDGIIGSRVMGYEARAILDKQYGSVLFALNLVGGTVEQLELRSYTLSRFGASLAVGYFLTPSVLTGIELRSENAYSNQPDDPSREHQHSALYGGPSVSFVGARYWLTLALSPQLLALKGATRGHHLDLSENEQLQTRLMLGFQL